MCCIQIRLHIVPVGVSGNRLHPNGAAGTREAVSPKARRAAGCRPIRRTSESHRKAQFARTAPHTVSWWQLTLTRPQFQDSMIHYFDSLTHTSEWQSPCLNSTNTESLLYNMVMSLKTLFSFCSRLVKSMGQKNTIYDNWQILEF